MRTPAALPETVNEALFYSCHDDQMPMFALQVASDLWQLCMPNIVIALAVFTCLSNASVISTIPHAYIDIWVSAELQSKTRPFGPAWIHSHASQVGSME